MDDKVARRLDKVRVMNRGDAFKLTLRGRFIELDYSLMTYEDPHGHKRQIDLESIESLEPELPDVRPGEVWKDNGKVWWAYIKTPPSVVPCSTDGCSTCIWVKSRDGDEMLACKALTASAVRILGPDEY
jgi:hypothetical protein